MDDYTNEDWKKFWTTTEPPEVFTARRNEKIRQYIEKSAEQRKIANDLIDKLPIDSDLKSLLFRVVQPDLSLDVLLGELILLTARYHLKNSDVLSKKDV